MLEMILDFFMITLIAMTAQNAIFARSLGVSEGLRMLRDERKNTLYFCASLFFFQIMSICLVYVFTPLIDATFLVTYRLFIMPGLIVLSCAISYLTTIFILASTLERRKFAKIIASLTSASINSAIVGTILLINSQNFNLYQAIAFGIGSSVGYLLALLLIGEKEMRIKRDKVPEAFRGISIDLIYIAIIALAIYGITGDGLIL